ncbi:hypothetical protein HYH03_009963 [Edaphochlamys debaryana]|uniref:Nephrocystin 3-like N-terminal domain-containing protein n=1 Tax=Edaphochlamys debaryana TaxID=47281 RepID=A0A836BY13_9CHLO|nr:hypothetical protein HYH03_009963 [Edaphochlamys debaryana]|eukprot:KAG2491803.1 hypothetical protein HYH03_009963 [Edaphochlamys debaryana]
MGAGVSQPSPPPPAHGGPGPGPGPGPAGEPPKPEAPWRQALKAVTPSRKQLTGAWVDPLAVTRLGITLGGLRRLRAKLQHKFAAKYKTISTADVNRLWVEEVTKRRKCRLVELEAEVHASEVRPPMYFISHAWKNRCSLLLDFVLERFLADAGDHVTVWLDILAVNQHEETMAHQHDIKAIAEVVRACGAGTIVVMDLANCNPATRGWCVYEWAHTLAAHGPDGLHLRLEPRERAEVFRTVDIQTAECQFPKDKEMILAAVEEQHGSAAAFNAKLRLQLLLQPLSYRVDLKRLTGRAKGTVWALGAVEEWVEAGAGGSRVLCIRGGAGEVSRGKSTISAVLCSEEAGGGLSGRITAFHFLKYNDQRRLEPVRMIKSLAFQLAHRLQPVCDTLLSMDAAQVAAMRDVDQAFTALLLGPLQALQAAQGKEKPPEQVVLLIDALDEADPLQLGGASGGKACPTVCGNKALQLVSNLFAKLPPWVRFVFTTRPEAAAGQVLPCLQRTFGDSVAYLQPSELRGATGVTTHGGAPSGPGRARGGVMIYHTVLAATATGPTATGPTATGPTAAIGGTGDSTPRAQQLKEPTLQDVYDLYGGVFRTAFAALSAQSPQQVRQVTDLLAVLMVAKQPLSQSFLAQLGLGSTLPLLPGHPVLFFAEEHHVYTLHKSLGDWLLDPAESGAFAVNVVNGHERIGLHLASTWRTAGSSMSYACLKYVAAHLAAAASPDSATGGSPSDSAIAALDVLLGDFSFFAAVLESGYSAQLIAVLGDMRTHTSLSYDAYRWLRSSQHDLMQMKDRSPRALAMQACSSGVAVNSRLYDRALRASGYAWGTRVVLPTTAGDWPATQAVLKGHTAGVGSVCFSPDGHQLASCSPDRSVLVWHVATGQCTATLEGHTRGITCVRFAPDGRQLATSSEDHTLRLWDAATGQCTAVLQGHTDGVTCVAFSRTARQLASGSDDKTVRLWDTSTGECTAVMEGHSFVVTCVAFSPDGRSLASGSFDENVRVWDVARRVPSLTLTAHRGRIFSVAFAPDGRLLASCSSDCTVRLWDAATGSCAATLKGHSFFVFSVAFSPDGRRLASGGSKDMCVRVWDTHTGQCSATLKGHQGWVNAVTFSPDGRQIVSGSKDKTLRIWDATTGQRAAVLQGPKGWTRNVSIEDLDLDPYDDLLLPPAPSSAPAAATTSGGAAANPRSDDRSGGLATAAGGHKSRVAFAFLGKSVGGDSANGRDGGAGGGGGGGGGGGWTGGGGRRRTDDGNTASGHASRRSVRDRGLKHWDTNNARTYTLQGHQDAVHAVAFAPDLRLVASGGGSRTWAHCCGGDAATGQCAGKLEGHWGAVVSLAFAPDGRRLASASTDRTVHLWDPSTLQTTHGLEGHSQAVASVSFSRDSKLLASGGEDKSVRVWDPGSGQAVATLQGHTGSVNAVLFSPGSRQLVTAGDDRTVRIWDLASNSTLAVLKGHTRGVTCLAASRDGRVLASGGGDKSVRLWDAASGNHTGALEGHAVRGIALSADGKTLAGGGGDGVVRIWDVAHEACTATLQGHSDGITCVSYGWGEAERLASASLDKTVRIWASISST